MAIQVMTDAWQHSKAEGTRLLVLLALADAADRETRLAYPGIKRIGEYARVSRSQVLRHIAALIEMGELARVTPPKGRKRAVFEILMGRTDARHNSDDRVASGAGIGSHLAPNRVASGADPIIEPSIEPSIEPPAPPTGDAAGNGATWMTPFTDLHLEILGGKMQAPKWARTFKQLETEHGLAAVLDVQRHYLENLAATGRQDFLDYHKMAESFGTWLAPQQKAGRPTRRIGGKDFDK